MEPTASALFTWKVEDFYSVKERGNFIKSSQFQVGEQNPTNWELELYPHGKNERKIQHVYLDLRILLSSSLKPQKLRVKVHISAFSNKEKLAELMCSNDFHDTVHGWDLFPRSKLDERNEKQVTISCFMQVYTDFRKSEYMTRYDAIFWDRGFQENVWERRQRSIRIDGNIEIESTGEHIPVHKVVLAARSDVFKAAFMNTSISSKFSYDCMFKLIEFIYLGELELDEIKGIVFDLYQAAHYYEVENLKNLCLHIMFEILNDKNAFQILEISWDEKCKQLFLNCVDFLRANDENETYLEECENISLRNPELGNYIRKVVIEKSEDESEILNFTDLTKIEYVADLRYLMWKLCSENVFTDMKLQGKDGFVECHKLLIEDYFLKEDTGCVKDIDTTKFSQKGLSILVKFLYTYKLDITSPSDVTYATEFLEMLDRLGIYLVETQITHIEKIVMSIMNVENAASIYYASWKYWWRYWNLKDKCFQFIINNLKIVTSEVYLDILSQDKEFLCYVNRMFAHLVEENKQKIESSLQIIQL